jgi:16S rRNA C1402 (ribose-2'-O) methylase RsmI
LRGPLGELAAKAAAGGITLRGEFVIVLEAMSGSGAAAGQLAGEGAVSMADGRARVARLVAGGAKRSDAARQVAAATGLDRHDLYRPD